MWGKINLYKEQNMTSQQAVSRLRRLLSIKKIGHSGTLDPMATGVLNCFVGQATKFIDLLPESEKVYQAGFILGKSSNTQDIWGQMEKRDFIPPTKEKVEEALQSFLGISLQLPPMYSAIKVKGKALYHYAREGKEIERKKREIKISKIELFDFDGQHGHVLLHCSRGTYVRSFLYDLGEILGTGAVMSSLVRLRNDWVNLEDCYLLDEIETLLKQGDHSFLTSPDQGVELCKNIISKELYLDLLLGRRKTLTENPGEGRVLLYVGDNFVGTALYDHEGLQREKMVQVDL